MAKTRAHEVVKLTPEVQAKLRNQLSKTQALKDSLAVMDGLGMDTTTIRDQLTWAEETAKTMLKEFT